MIIAVDRIEKDKIVFITEDNKQFVVDKSVFPLLKEGDMISAYVDKELTKNNKTQMENRLKNLFNR